METERHQYPESESSELTTASIAGRAERSERFDEGAPNANRREIPIGTQETTRPAGVIAPQPTAGTGSGAITGAGTAAAVAPAREPIEESSGPLFSQDEAENLRSRWDRIQVGFVDEPRSAVEQADHLVAEAMKRLAEIFAGERAGLEQQWSRGNNVSTEDLRQALRRYRSFFGRLLSM
jgi:hypothetical protein